MAAKRKRQISEDGDEADDGPERQCAVTRQSGDADALIRFVLAPDGQIVPDLERRLPGRGVWVTCARAILEKAINTKAFSRNLKVAVHVPIDLIERMEILLIRRAADTLALANKAGLVVAGFQKVDTALDKGSLAAVVHGSDAAEDGRGKLDRKFKAIQAAKGAKAPICAVLSIEQMSLAMGRPSVVHAGLLPGGLTERFLREAERVSRYRAPSVVSGSLPGQQIQDLPRTEG